MYKNNFFDNTSLYSILFTFLIDLLLIIFIHASWNNTVGALYPLHKEATTLRNDLTEAHLWLEEALGNDKSIDIQNDVFIPFQHERFSTFTKKLRLPEYKEIQNEFIKIDSSLDTLYTMAKKRLKDTENGGIGSELDQIFDKKFNDILYNIDQTIEKINIKTTSSIDEKNNNFKLVIAFLLFINILLFLLLFLIKKYKGKLKENESTYVRNARLASMGEMLENIAHQWRQPLNLIATGTTSLKIKNDLGTLSDKYFDEVISSINKNVQYLSQTINDFSNFSKKDKEATKFNLSENINSFIKLIDSSLKTFQINAILNLKEDIVINSFPNELNQVLMNLFNNTKDAFKDKELQKNQKYIFITTHLEKDYAILEFKDSAGGIDENVINKIFEPYFTTKHKAEGTGLGLHMSYNIIVNSMEGTIGVENKSFEYKDKELKGTKFTITIPLNKKQNT